MSKASKVIIAVVAIALIGILVPVAVFGIMYESYKPRYDEVTDPQGYAATIATIGFDNTSATAFAQTEIQKVLIDHFAEDNGKSKKAVVLGWDGARADALAMLDDTGAVSALSAEGGKYLGYCGGIEGDKETMQDTSTAPGWAAMITGVWGNQSMVKTNGLFNLKPTVFRKLGEMGYSSAFDYIWASHGYTYNLDKSACALKGYDVTYHKMPNKDKLSMDEMDVLLRDKVIADIADDKDLVFCIFEGPDSNGHSEEFNNQCANYVKAVKNCDAYSMQVVNAIKARATYAEEDWLIILTADHGGNGEYGHGAQVVECRTIFAVSNKEIF